VWEDLKDWAELGAILFLVAEILAVVSIAHAVMSVRTSQGTWAWAMALLFFPPLTVPLYWVFGRRNFHGYKQTMKEAAEGHADLVEAAQLGLENYRKPLVSEEYEYGSVVEKLSRHRFTGRNHVELLVDGEATFDAIFAGIESATDYVLVQFFIIKEDKLGEKLKQLLLKKAKEGVRVYLLYDEIGSHKLKRRTYQDVLRAGGVKVTAFQTTQGKSNRFQVNFRNHRKIVVVDGREAYVGGHNVGDEYLGESERFGRWRDTHVKVVGPAALSTQGAFMADWYWAERELLELNWEIEGVSDSTQGMTVLSLPTGPVGDIESGTLFFLNAINRARHRLWITSPYFVPDEPVSYALQLAALRGVDVRIMLPEKPDHKTVYLAGFSYLRDMDAAGVKMYRYHDGFLHQKVMLVDDQLASVGTVNLDNRSLRLNFEISILVIDKGFCRDLEKMLEEDFRHCRRIDGRDYSEKKLPFRVAVRIARLFAPVL